jgi:trimethylamine--corrinoid protein Co-methyltransferase
MIMTHGSNMTSAHYARLGPAECERIHMATLEVLERVGIEVHDERARGLLVKGGAKADGIKVRIPEWLVSRSLDLAPKRMTLYDRKGRAAIRAWGYHTHFGGGSDCLNVLDHRTSQRRRGLLQDVCEAATLMDALPEIDFVMSAFLPSDVDQRIYDRYQMEVMLNHTTKPIVFVAPDVQGCVAAVEMCEIVAGGAGAFQHKPFATFGVDRQCRSTSEVHVPGGQGTAAAVHPAERGRRELSGNDGGLHGHHECRDHAGGRVGAAGQ